jgi:uncharacterized membrane protein YdbT with pleckstrin-like domain
MASRRAEGFPRELLTSDETILLEIRPSPVPFVIAPALAMSTVLIVFLIGFAVLAVASVPLAIRTCGLPLVVLSIVLVLTSFLGYLTWMNTFYAVTDKRVLQKSGLIGMNAFDAPLTSIQNVTLMQPFFFKLFKIGTIVFATSGTGGGAAVQRAQVARGMANAMWLAGNIVFAGVRDPVAMRKRVQELVEAAVARQKERDYRKMAETFKEVGTSPMATVTIPPGAVPAPPVATLAPPRKTAKFCEFCGARIEGAPTFCAKCGGRVN